TLTRIKSVKEKEQHNLRIGSGHAWWNTFVRDCFNLYSSRYPSVNIHIDIGNHLRLIDLLLTGDIDLFIGHEIHGLNPGIGIHFAPFFSVRDKMFARNGHPLCGELVTPEALLDYPYLKLTPDEKRYRKIVGDLKKNSLNNNSLHMTEPVIWSTNSLISAIDILKHSDAVLRAYPGTMTAFFAEHNIVPLRSSHKGEVNIVGMYCLRERWDTPQIVEIQMLMQEHLKYAEIS
ncbi:TPA: substrate-binding domain-containing protein, partial [Raoultella planticola]